MTDFSILAGVATVTDPELFTTWLDRPDYAAALAASPDPAIAAVKRLVVDFEVALARMVRSGRVEEEVEGILERFLAEDYVQHDPNVEGNGRAPLAAYFRRLPPDGGTPPPPVCVLVEGDLVCVMMQAPMPDPTSPGSTYDWFIPTIFRVRDGRLAEHWAAFKKAAAGSLAPADL